MQPTAAEKVQERRLRRAALRKGLHLRKSCVLDPDHPEFGKWWVVTTPARYPEAWRSLGRELTPRDGLTLAEVEEFVEAYRARRVPPDISELVGPSARPVPGRPA